MAREIEKDQFSTENLVSELLDVWDQVISEPAEELGLRRNIKFHISAKDHWSVNGILPTISDWQKSHSDSILWISSSYLGRDSWLTQFSLDLIHAAQIEEHAVTFAMCDRPETTQWTCLSLIKQLIWQTIYLHPQMVMELPSLLNLRMFKKAMTMEKVLHIFRGFVEKFDSLLVLIDRIDLCSQEQAHEGRETLRQLSSLARAHPEKLKIIITCAEDIPDNTFANLSISIAKVDLKKKKRQAKKTNFLQGQQINSRRDPAGPTFNEIKIGHVAGPTINASDFLRSTRSEEIEVGHVAGIRLSKLPSTT